MRHFETIPNNECILIIIPTKVFNIFICGVAFCYPVIEAIEIGGWFPMVNRSFIPVLKQYPLFINRKNKTGFHSNIAISCVYGGKENKMVTSDRFTCYTIKIS